jgi:choline dehydrogenase-like flavoprotein
VRLLLALVALALVPAPAAAQTPPPDERAAAQAFADAAKRLVDAANAVGEDPGRLEDCRALRREPPNRQGPVREARALERRLDELTTRGTMRKIVAAADRMIELGVSREDADAFRSLVS